jgi:hypothetical protein
MLLFLCKETNVLFIVCQLKFVYLKVIFFLDKGFRLVIKLFICPSSFDWILDVFLVIRIVYHAIRYIELVHQLVIFFLRAVQSEIESRNTKFS